MTEEADVFDFPVPNKPYSFCGRKAPWKNGRKVRSLQSSGTVWKMRWTSLIVFRFLWTYNNTERRYSLEGTRIMYALGVVLNYQQTSFMVSVDVRYHIRKEERYVLFRAQELCEREVAVPNKSYAFCGRKAPWKKGTFSSERCERWDGRP